MGVVGCVILVRVGRSGFGDVGVVVGVGRRREFEGVITGAWRGDGGTCCDRRLRLASRSVRVRCIDTLRRSRLWRGVVVGVVISSNRGGGIGSGVGGGDGACERCSEPGGGWVIVRCCCCWVSRGDVTGVGSAWGWRLREVQ